MTTIIAYAIMASALVAVTIVSYYIGKALGQLIDWTVETIRKAFH